MESSGGTLGGVATFSLTSGGQLQAIAGVLSADVTSVATIPVDNDDNLHRYTGFAIANPGSSSINIKIVAVNQDGTIVDAVSPPGLNPLPARQQVARFLHDYLPNRATFRGSMVLVGQAGTTFSVVALVQVQGDTGPLYTAIPVIPAKAPNIN